MWATKPASSIDSSPSQSGRWPGQAQAAATSSTAAAPPAAAGRRLITPSNRKRSTSHSAGTPQQASARKIQRTASGACSTEGSGSRLYAAPLTARHPTATTRARGAPGITAIATPTPTDKATEAPTRSINSSIEDMQAPGRQRAGGF